MRIHELGHVVFYVTNLQKSVHFYKTILGFPEIAKAPGMAVFSTGRTHHELLLIEIGGKLPLKKQPTPGLYHFGLKIGNSRKELEDAIRELELAKVTIVGTADHTVTLSVYILDPDNNEVELYVDVSDRWRREPKMILSQPRPL
ncbi:VOC family protein [Candidatus Woesearchaeota archaeon]|nr:VOC family protein [Candidatus Woesearchaeota archaeon]